MFHQTEAKHTTERGTDYIAAQLFYCGVPVGQRFYAHTREELIAFAVKHVDRHTATNPRFSADRDAWYVRIIVDEMEATR